MAHTTIRGYLDALASALVVRLLPPWFENLKKRQVKSPKVYVRDSGVLHALLDLGSAHAVEGHPKVGASWEGFALENVIQHLGARPEQCHSWGTYSGAELDLMVQTGVRRLGFEFKRTSAPRLTRSMRSSIESLGLERLDVLHPGGETFPLASGVRAVGIRRLREDMDPLPG